MSRSGLILLLLLAAALPAAAQEAGAPAPSRELTAELEVLADEETANTVLRASADGFRDRADRRHREREEFQARVARPRELAIQRERATVDAQRLSSSEFLERSGALDQELGDLALRIGALREELEALRTLRKMRAAQGADALARLQRAQDRTRGLRDAAAAGPGGPQAVRPWDDLLQKQSDTAGQRRALVRREQELTGGLEDTLEQHAREAEALRADVAAWRETLVAGFSRVSVRFFGLVLPLDPRTGIPLIAGVVLLATLLLIRAARSRLKRWGEKTGSPGVRGLLRALVFHTPALFGLAAALALANGLPLSPGFAAAANRVLFVTGTAVAFVLLAQATIAFAGRAGTGELQGPVKTVIRIGYATIAVLIVLDTLNVSITPVLTTLGVGSVAVALALQETLSNFFAGLYVVADKPVQIGDYVKLDSGFEGYVVEISWRSTRIRQLSNNIVIVPNQKLAQSVIVNYMRPDRRVALSIPIFVDTREDPARVERVVTEVAREALGQVEGLLPDPPPGVSFNPGFGPSSLDFTLGFSVRAFEDQGRVQHELRKRILDRFRKEGIRIPYPTQTLHIASEPGSGPPPARRDTPGA